MRQNEILIRNDGVTLFGYTIGLTPKAGDIEAALEHLPTRNSVSDENAQFQVCDSCGLSWVVADSDKAVLRLNILLAEFDYRKRFESEPTSYFDGRLCIGKYSVRGPFSLQIAEIVRKVSIPGLSFLLVPDGKTIRSVLVTFKRNEQHFAFQTDKSLKRCSWANGDLYIEYHDKEWGVPVHDDRHLFEMLILEGAQAGLSWITILKKRENYRKAFDNFDARKIAGYDARKVQKLLADPGIVRNKLKVNATIQNAQAFLAVQKEFGSFDKYIWQFVGGKPILNSWKKGKTPAKTKESDAMSKDLLKRGFKFVGSTICYAYMQAVGMVNDHVVDCFLHKKA